MAQRFLFFVAGHVFGASCSPFSVETPNEAIRMRDLIRSAFPGEEISIYQRADDDSEKVTLS